MSDACEKASLYIPMVEDALKQVERGSFSLEEDERKLIELSSLYLEDAKYYFQRGDCSTAIAAVSYAEGLLDSLAIRGKIKIEWKRERPKRVVVAGTFDILHPGHLHFIKSAAKLGEVYVIVSRDENSKKAKGRETIFPERSRLEMVRSLKWVRDAVLGDRSDFLKPIVELSPDIIVLGPDQKVREEELKRELEKRGLKNVEVIRLERRETGVTPNSTTSIILEIMKKFCMPPQAGEEK